jgi:hypothetical protein
VAGPFLSVGGAVVGHATGRTVSAVQEPKPIRSSPDVGPSPATVRAMDELATTQRKSTGVLE